MSSVWACLAKVAIAGACGGLINTLLKGEGFTIPGWKKGVFCPGFVGDIIVGAAAASVSWGLYGAGSGIDLAADNLTERQVISLTISALAGAFLVGIGGARWLTAEIEGKIAQKNTSTAASLERVNSEELENLHDLPPFRQADLLEEIKVNSSK